MFSLLKVHGKRTVDIDEQIHSSTHRQYPKMHDLRDFIHQIYLCWFYSAVLACRLYCIYCQYNRRLPRDTGKSILHKTYIIPFHSLTHTREFYSRDLFFFCVLGTLRSAIRIHVVSCRRHCRRCGSPSAKHSIHGVYRIGSQNMHSHTQTQTWNSLGSAFGTLFIQHTQSAFLYIHIPVYIRLMLWGRRRRHLYICVFWCECVKLMLESKSYVTHCCQVFFFFFMVCLRSLQCIAFSVLKHFPHQARVCSFGCCCCRHCRGRRSLFCVVHASSCLCGVIHEHICCVFNMIENTQPAEMTMASDIHSEWPST